MKVDLDHIKIICTKCEKEEVHLLATQPFCTALLKNIIQYYAKSLNELRKYVIESEFISKEDEIHFFKNVKPNILGKYLYYIKLLDIYTRTIDLSRNSEISYLKRVIKKSEKHLSEHVDLLVYVKKEKSHFDTQYFTCVSIEKLLEINPYALKEDYTYSSPKSFTMASCHANRMTKNYCLTRIAKLKIKSTTSSSSSSSLTWQKSKIDLIELLEALHLVGAFDCDFKTLVLQFGEFLNLDKLDPYNNISKIRTRAPKDRSKFLDKCKNSLVADIEEYLSK